MAQSFLVPQTNDPTMWHLMSLWPSRQALEDD
jgi:hypothetical protein